MASIRTSDELTARFLAGYVAGPLSECWEWSGSRDVEGYGRFKFNGRAFKAHRYAYAYFKSAPGQLLVLHRCDNPPCVNPTHLVLGTNLDNIRDRHTKGRDAKGDRNASRKYPWIHAGERHARHKLTDDQVRDIRSRWSSGLWTQERLGQAYGIKQVTVSCIVRRATWRHVL